jgi:hypothetical protein
MKQTRVFVIAAGGGTGLPTTVGRQAPARRSQSGVASVIQRKRSWYRRAVQLNPASYRRPPSLPFGTKVRVTNNQNGRRWL